MNARRSRHGCRGTNLVEVMTTISILSLTMAFGVPSYDHLATRSQRQQVASELKGAFTLARSEAGRRGSIISVCASADRSDCSSDSSPNWNQGWLVFVDNDEDGTRDDSDEILYSITFANPKFSLTSESALASGVSFQGIGFPSRTGSFAYSDSGYSQTLTLSFAGHLDSVD